MKTSVLFLLMASAAIAGPDFADLARRLADEDPDVRRAAAEELLQLDESAAPAIRAEEDRATDPEARAALREIREELVERPNRELAVDWLYGWNFTDADQPPVAALDAAGPRSLRALVWAMDNPGAVMEAADRRLRGRTNGVEPRVSRSFGTDVLQSLARAALEGLTLARSQDPHFWADFAEEARTLDWREIRLRGLESRGIAVRSVDASQGGANLVDFWRTQIRDMVGRRVWMAPGFAQAFDGLVADLFAGDPLLPAVREREGGLGPWLAACHGQFARDGDRWICLAGPAEFAAALDPSDLAVLKAALVALRHWPDRVPEDAWKWVKIAPLPVLRLRAAEGVPLAGVELVDALEITGEGSASEDLAPLWDLDRVAATFSDDSTPRFARLAAAAVLARRGERRHRAVLEEFIARDLPSTALPRQDIAFIAALGLASRSEEDAVASAIHWVKNTYLGPARFEVMRQLVSAGHRGGLELYAETARLEVLPEEEQEWLRGQVEGAPARDDWEDWGKAEARGYSWDPISRKWRR